MHPTGHRPRGGRNRIRLRPVKQVIVVNESLGLPRGKLASQVAHAAVQGYLAANPTTRRTWLDAGMPKVVLRASSEAGLLDLLAHAQGLGLRAALIRDAGRTVVAPGTVTCLCIGPAAAERIDPLTGGLPLVN